MALYYPGQDSIDLVDNISKCIDAYSNYCAIYDNTTGNTCYPGSITLGNASITDDVSGAITTLQSSFPTSAQTNVIIDELKHLIGGIMEIGITEMVSNSANITEYKTTDHGGAFVRVIAQECFSLTPAVPVDLVADDLALTTAIATNADRNTLIDCINAYLVQRCPAIYKLAISREFFNDA